MSTEPQPTPSVAAILRRLEPSRDEPTPPGREGPPGPPTSVAPEFSGGSANPPRRHSGNCQKRMLWISGIGLVLLAMVNQATATGEHGSLWRVLLAIAAFLYAWWLGSIVFDLVFIWHRYIQADAAHEFLRTVVAAPDYRSRSGPDTEGPGTGADIRPPSPGTGGPSIPIPVPLTRGTVYVETVRRPTA